MGYNIAIDGPAGAGKSTIAKKTAKVKYICNKTKKQKKPKNKTRNKSDNQKI